MVTHLLYLNFGRNMQQKVACSNQAQAHGLKSLSPPPHHCTYFLTLTQPRQGGGDPWYTLYIQPHQREKKLKTITLTMYVCMYVPMQQDIDILSRCTNLTNLQLRTLPSSPSVHPVLSPAQFPLHSTPTLLVTGIISTCRPLYHISISSTRGEPRRPILQELISVLRLGGDRGEFA